MIGALLLINIYRKIFNIQININIVNKCIIYIWAAQVREVACPGSEQGLGGNIYRLD